MAYTPSPENYFLGKGALYFDRFDSDGNSTGELHLGNCPDFSISVEVETKEHRSSLSGLSEKDIELITGVNATVKFTLEEFVTENLLLAFLGEQGTLTQSSGSVTDETITARLNRWIKLEHRKISNVVVKNEDGSVTYTVDEDYRVDAETGRIYIVPDGAITDGQTLKVSYDYSSIDLNTVRGLKNAETVGFLRFIPADDQQGPKHEVEIWKARLWPAGEIGFISDDWAQMTIEGAIIKDEENHPNEPYFRLIPRD
ncbi:MAG TPA: hypothetical protein ENF83_02155 [Candidatus Korarchaeota archaeon]|nr:hypothetical protein [Candidatus Korarchaeota archaeon]